MKLYSSLLISGVMDRETRSGGRSASGESWGNNNRLARLAGLTTLAGGGCLSDDAMDCMDLAGGRRDGPGTAMLVVEDSRRQPGRALQLRPIEIR